LLDVFKKLDSSRSYQELRDKIKDSGKNTIPLFTLCLRELRNLEESMNDSIPSRDAEGKDIQLVNLKKHLLITEIVNSLIQYQSSMNFDFDKKEEPLYSFLICPPLLSEEDIKSRGLELARENNTL